MKQCCWNKENEKKKNQQEDRNVIFVSGNTYKNDRKRRQNELPYNNRQGEPCKQSTARKKGIERKKM